MNFSIIAEGITYLLQAVQTASASKARALGIEFEIKIYELEHSNHAIKYPSVSRTSSPQNHSGISQSASLEPDETHRS